MCQNVLSGSSSDDLSIGHAGCRTDRTGRPRVINGHVRMLTPDLVLPATGFGLRRRRRCDRMCAQWSAAAAYNCTTNYDAMRPAWLDYQDR